MAREREEGLAALQRGDLPTAAILLELVVRQDKEDFESHLYLGGVYHQMRRNGDAVRVLTRATELQPDSAQARFNLGVAQEQSGDLTGAQASFQQAILLQAEYPVAHEALERVEARLNGPVQSPDATLTSSLERSPEPPTEFPSISSLASSSEMLTGEDRQAFAPLVKSSFGKSSPASFTSSSLSASASAPVSPVSDAATPASSAEQKAEAPGGASASTVPTEAPSGTDAPRAEWPGQNTVIPPVMPPLPPNPYTPGYGANPYPPQPPPPGYAPGYAPPRYAQAPIPGQPPAYGQPLSPDQMPPYGQPPYGQPPYGAGYAPPGMYGYGGAQQYVVTQPPVPQEATIALILSILGLPVVCTGLGIVFSPISLFLALKARRMMQADPRLGGQGTVTAALWLSYIGLGLNILVWIAFIIAMLRGG